MKTIGDRIYSRLEPFLVAYRLAGLTVLVYRIRNGIDLRIRANDSAWYSYTIRGIGKDMILFEDITAGHFTDTMTYKEAVDTIISDITEPA